MTDQRTYAPPRNRMLSGNAIAFSDISVSFGTFKALSAIDFGVKSGTIHALVGQNGAGKSTALGILAGRVSASSGHIEVFGKHAELGSPRRAHQQGITAIYQELTIIPQLSAVENVFLGQNLSKGGVVSSMAMTRRYLELAERIGVSIPADVLARRLSVADQQILEIMRAVQSDAKILLFDEPTASLAPAERRALFRLMQDLRASGHTMIFVSHNLEEVFEIADDITVFRNGRLIASRTASEWSKPVLIAAMLGEAMTNIYHRREGTVPAGSEILKASRVSVPRYLHDVDLSVRKGEILGIAGLAGAGRTTLLRALAGAEPKATGELHVGGKLHAWPTEPSKARKLGIALVPEERKTEGLVMGMCAADNIALPNLSRFRKFRFLSESRLKASAKAAAAPFHFDPSRLSEPVGNLSGGNQQKALLARWKLARPVVLLVDEPTRGIDIGAKAEILDALRTLCDEGTSIIMVSSELEEIVSLADRVIVLSEGRKVNELWADKGEVSLSTILNSAFAVEGHHV